MVLQHFIKTSKPTKDKWSFGSEETDRMMFQYPKQSIPLVPIERSINAKPIGPFELSFIYPTERAAKSSYLERPSTIPPDTKLLDISNLKVVGYQDIPPPINAPFTPKPPINLPLSMKPISAPWGYIPPPIGPDISELPRCPAPGCKEPTPTSPYKGRVMIPGGQLQPVQVMEPYIPVTRSTTATVTPKLVIDMMPKFREKIVCSECAQQEKYSPAYAQELQQRIPGKHKYLTREEFYKKYPYAQYPEEAPATVSQIYRFIPKKEIYKELFPFNIPAARPFKETSVPKLRPVPEPIPLTPRQKLGLQQAFKQKFDAYAQSKMIAYDKGFRPRPDRFLVSEPPRTTPTTRGVFAIGPSGTKYIRTTPMIRTPESFITEVNERFTGGKAHPIPPKLTLDEARADWAKMRGLLGI
jgi:hypothetical protein